MTLFESVILGLVQGLGEFLPISSSAHLVIAPWLLRFPDPGLTFDVALHFGTLAAVLAYFWKDWVRLTRAAVTSVGKKRVHYTHDEKMFWYLVLATIPGAMVGYLLESYAETVFRSPLLIALSMTVMGIVLMLADERFPHQKGMGQMRLKDCLWIGLSQALAIVPGVSRSGITISTARFLGLTREAAARFSFLLATPIIAGAALLKVKPFLEGMGSFNSWIGIGISAVVGLLSIKYLLRYVQKRSYRIFVLYRFVFSLVVVAVYFLRG